MADVEAISRKIVEIFATGTTDGIAIVIDDAYVDHQGLGDIEIRGPSGFRQVVEALHRNANVAVTIEDIVASDDRVAVRLGWSYVTPSEERVRRETLDLLRFVDGRLAEHWGAEISTSQNRLAATTGSRCSARASSASPFISR